MQTKPIVPLADIVKEGFIMVALSVIQLNHYYLHHLHKQGFDFWQFYFLCSFLAYLHPQKYFR